MIPNDKRLAAPVFRVIGSMLRHRGWDWCYPLQSDGLANQPDLIAWNVINGAGAFHVLKAYRDPVAEPSRTVANGIATIRFNTVEEFAELLDKGQVRRAAEKLFPD